MPHFALLVITDDAAPETLERVLLPYREVLDGEGVPVSGKWDEWKIGGNFSGMLLSREEAILGSKIGPYGEQFTVLGFDQLRKDQLDFREMALRNREKRLDLILDAYNGIRAKSGMSFMEITRLWDRFCELFPTMEHQWLDEIDQRREAFRRDERVVPVPPFFEWAAGQNDEMRAIVEARIHEMAEIFVTRGNPQIPLTEPDPLEWADRAPSISVLAVLDHEGWHERADLGWLPLVLRGKSAGTWETEVQALEDRARPDQYLTIVDCHV